MDPRGPQQRHTVTDTQLATSIGLTLRDLPGDWHAANGSLSFDTPEAGAARRKSLLGVARWLAERTIDS
jgi:hypothetical protein